MNWQTLILLHALIGPFSILAMRAVAKQRSAAHWPFTVNAGMFSFAYLTGLALLPFMSPVNFSSLTQYWPWFIGGGICFALTNAFWYKVLAHLDAGISGILSTLGVLFTIVLAALVLHEDLSVSQAVGGFLLLAAICYILTVAKQPGAHRLHSKSWLLGLTFSIIGGVFFAIALVNEKFLLGKMPTSSYFLFGWGGQALMAYVTALIFERRHFGLLLRPKIGPLVAVGGITRGIAGYFFIMSQIKSNNVALVTVVANIKLILIVLFGAWLLNERQKLTEKLTAAFLALAGLSIIFWK